MNDYFITKPARSDPRDIWNFFAERSERVADRLLDDITEQFDLIAEQPLLVGHKDIIYGTEYRICAVRNYVIFYEILDHGVQIVRVVHGSRDPDSMFL